MALLIAAVLLYLWAGSDDWFIGDEWPVLIRGDGGDLRALLTPANEHWITLPRLSYRLLFNAFGLNTYVPYQLLAITLHLGAATLLRVVMRRSGVSPWMATITAGAFVLLGSGHYNILRAFQVTFGGALVFGLMQLVLADHDGPIDRRDVVALIAGVAALMCSGVAIAMVAAVTASAAIRRGWRAALFQSVPLVAVYALWLFFFARDHYSSKDLEIGSVVSFVGASMWATFDALGQVPVIGALIALLLVVGVVLAWRHPLDQSVRRRNAAVMGLVFGALVFVTTTAWSRASFGADYASQSRYVHILAALLIPALAVGADTVARRWPVAAPAVVVLLLVGIPGNIDAAWNHGGSQREGADEREFVLAFASVPAAADAPAWARPDPRAIPGLTMGWLRDGIERGRVPRVPVDDPALAEEATFSIVVQQVGVWKLPEGCQPLTARTPLHLEPGESIRFRGSIVVLKNDPTFASQIVKRFEGTAGSALQAVLQPVDVIVGPFNGKADLCERRPA